MSLEDKIENLTTAIVDLKEVLFEALTNGMKATQQTNVITVEEKPKQTRTRAAKAVEMKPETKAVAAPSEEWGAETVIEERSLMEEEEANNAEAGEEVDDWETEFNDFGSTKPVEIMDADQLREQLNNLISAFTSTRAKKEGVDEKTMKTKLITKIRQHCGGKSITEIAPEERKPLLDWVVKTELKD